ncbi:SDR family oxidoreductase [Streptomyces aculeolatus]
MDTQVAVVGAGPVGLMLAGELRLAGVQVVVVEQRPAPTTESRASTLHARTMELLDQRGLAERFLPAPNDLAGHFGGIPLPLTLDSPYAGQWKVPQARTEELLGAWARELGADIRRGRQVTGLTQTADHVELQTDGPGGEQRLRAAYVAGCDGEQSTVRRLAGVAFPGKDAERELIRADVDGITVPDRRFQRLAAGLAIAARRPDGVTRVMVHEFGRPAGAREDGSSGGEPGFADIAAAWRRVTGEDIAAGTPLWVNAFGDTLRQAARYRTGRVLLAGDAAHRQLPIGGQALNLGLQDAANLGWKLAAHLNGTATGELLDSYHSERHTVGARVLANIQAQALLLLGAPDVEPVRSVLAELIAHEPVRRHLAGMISGLDIRYNPPDTHPHPGPDKARDRGRDPLAGTRLPPTRLRIGTGHAGTQEARTTAELLHSGRGLLLAFDHETGPAAEQASRAAAPWTARGRLRTVRAEPPARGPLADRAAVLVRPDGYIAWTAPRAPGAAPEPLTAALTRWFGPRPTPTPEPAAAPSPASAPAVAAGGTPATRTPAPRNTAATTAAPPANERIRRPTMGNLDGKTALVTGASRGMGRATALRLARQGALVAVHYGTSTDEAGEVAALIEKDGGRAFTVQAELGVPGDVHQLFLGLEQALKERTGTTTLDILVNNAGVMGGVKPEDTTPETFDRLIAVNAKAPFFLIQRALADMPDGGRIINITTGLNRFANPDEIAYAMSKGALEQLALHYAKHLGPRRITINSVAPGITRNSNPVFTIPEAVEQMAALSTFNRVGEPEDVADVVAFLASDDARWITGSFVDATGGTLLG